MTQAHAAGSERTQKMGEKISVVICTYNYGRFLGQCLESVQKQTHPPDEIVVVDDGSQDETAQVARRFEGVRYVWQENAGKAAAFNRGLRAASGDILCHLDADDYWEPLKLERIAAELRANPQLGGVVHDIRQVDAEERPIDSGARESLPAEPVIQTLDDFEDVGFLYALPQARGRVLGATNTISVRRSTVDDLFPAPEAIQLSVDGLLVAGAVRRGLLYLPQPLSVYRCHGGNYSYGNPSSTTHTVRMWEFLLETDSFRRSLSARHAALLRAKLLEREAYVATRTGENALRGALAALQVPLILWRNGFLCNWKHLLLPIACVVPVRRVSDQSRHSSLARHPGEAMRLGST